MANARSGNTYYIDGTSTTLSEKNLRVTHVTITATSASAVLLLKDVSTDNIKADLRVATAGDSVTFDFSLNPIVFANGINPATVTNCVASLQLIGTKG